MTQAAPCFFRGGNKTIVYSPGAVYNVFAKRKQTEDIAMPSSWKRSPEELHKTYIANTEAFYKVAGRGLSGELDSFISDCALQLWGRCGGVTQEHVDAINQLYSKGAVMPKWLLWELTESAEAYFFLGLIMGSSAASKKLSRRMKPLSFTSRRITAYPELSRTCRSPAVLRKASKTSVPFS